MQTKELLPLRHLLEEAALTSLQAKDPLDKIYGILSLARDGPELGIDVGLHNHLPRAVYRTGQGVHHARRIVVHVKLRTRQRSEPYYSKLGAGLERRTLFPTVRSYASIERHSRSNFLCQIPVPHNRRFLTSTKSHLAWSHHRYDRLRLPVRPPYSQVNLPPAARVEILN
jgi:hypothetical protein